MIKTVALFILFVLLFLPAYSQEDDERNFFLDTWQVRTYTVPTEFKIKQEPEISNVVQIIVDAADTINKVLPVQCGANITFRSGDGILTENDRLNTFIKSGVKAYRFPAGSGSNIYFFDGNIPSSFQTCLDKENNPVSWNPIDGTKSTALKPENFIKLVEQVNGEAIIVVNYFYARYGVTDEGTREARVLQAAKYAAEFVRKMNVELNANVKYWEVGNECYGPWETGYNVEGLGNVTGTEYGEDFRVFVSEMKKVDPDIKVGAVLYTKDTDWNPQVVSEVQDDADFFIIHQYFTTAGNATPENILGAVGVISENIEMLRNTVEQNTNYTLDHFPVALTEFNSRGNYTTNMVNSVFFTQILGEVMKNGLGLSTTWTGEWKYNPDDPDNQVKSLLAINDPDQYNYTPYPVFMSYYFYDKMFGDHMVASTVTNSTDVNAYASRFASGELGISVVNPTAEDVAIAVTVNNAYNYKLTNVYWYEVRGSFEYRNTKFYINEETGNTTGGGPDNYDQILPYGKIFNNGDTIVIPPYSSNFIVIKGRKSTGIFNTPKKYDDIRLYPNPVSEGIFINSDLNIAHYTIYDIAGNVLLQGVCNKNKIDVSFLNTGIYIVKLQTDKGERVIEFVKK
ncbi:MAG: T9SS type A sorting domain-containing protein [Chlorobi bacterium]|nr:T9SS type A sorting domain-containing protein [Chlorobiota bacterium]